RSDAYFASPLAQGTPGKQCGLAATGDYQPSLRSPWLAAWDGLDEGALHLLAVERKTGEPVGTSRLLQSGQIGRMAVIRSWRGRGVGKALLQKLLVIADQNGYPSLFLNAQSTALSFYAQRGFIAEGDEFMDAGIPHRRMTKESLNNA
ncbi:MAG: GNAT family N-acetyltransferase, partial [gamma proteobacterium endosymbiont of Lamellibrachia anaximandri]|nr:GNAT family N-acetyltransferase [gamma proteobacterium endosymbiont of Lamellibrachia anaximandri]